MKKLTLLLGVLLLGSLLYAQISRDITITIPQDLVSDTLDAYAFVYNYRVSVPNPAYCPQDEFDAGSCTPLDETQWIANPEGKAAFANRILAEETQERVRQVYVTYMVKVGSDAAAAQADVDAAGIVAQ